MNRRALYIAVLAFLLTPFSAFAYEEARLNPTSLVLRVGEASDVEVGVHHLSGLNYTMWGFSFRSDREEVVALDGTLDYAHPVWGGTIHVMALAPGTAQIMAGDKVYATVEVVCTVVQPMQAIAPVITAKKGETLKLSVTTTTEIIRVVQWYAGRTGDTSHPLTASSANSTDLEITPAEAGTHYVWASAKSPCSSSSAEFRIDVLASRRRAVGR
jgi:hypothetical protein